MLDVQNKKPITTVGVLLILLATFPICAIFLFLREPGNARAGWFLSAVIVIAVRVRWDLHKKMWFWPTIAVISLVHILAIIMVPWTSRWIPSVVIFPFCAVDGVAILGILQLMEKLKPS
jgi:hypothetical protein